MPLKVEGAQLNRPGKESEEHETVCLLAEKEQHTAGMQNLDARIDSHTYLCSLTTSPPEIPKHTYPNHHGNGQPNSGIAEGRRARVRVVECSPLRTRASVGGPQTVTSSTESGGVAITCASTPTDRPTDHTHDTSPHKQNSSDVLW